MNCIICNEYSDGSVTTFRNEQVPLCSKCIKQAAADLAGQNEIVLPPIDWEEIDCDVEDVSSEYFLERSGITEL